MGHFDIDLLYNNRSQYFDTFMTCLSAGDKICDKANYPTTKGHRVKEAFTTKDEIKKNKDSIINRAVLKVALFLACRTNLCPFPLVLSCKPSSKM